MNQLEILSCSLEYIENHLESDIRTEDVARACYCSKSTLEKLFRCINNISVRDYLIRRRMTKAARVLVEQPDKGITKVEQTHCKYQELFTKLHDSIMEIETKR